MSFNLSKKISNLQNYINNMAPVGSNTFTDAIIIASQSMTSPVITATTSLTTPIVTASTSLTTPNIIAQTSVMTPLVTAQTSITSPLGTITHAINQVADITTANIGTANITNTNITGSIIATSIKPPGTTNDLIVGSGTSGWITQYTKDMGVNIYPLTNYGTTSLSTGWNFAGNTGEIDFINNFGNTSGFLSGFNFYNRTGASSNQLLATINSTGITVPAIIINSTSNRNGIIFTGGAGIANGGWANTFLSTLPNNIFTIGMGATPTITAGAVNHIAFSIGNASVNGSISTNSGGVTSFSTSSDARFKKNIKSFEGLPLLNLLNPQSYSMIIDDTNTIYHGFIAQEVEVNFPQYAYMLLKRMIIIQWIIPN